MTNANNTGHDAVVELLPWYVNGTLSRAEQASVEQHLPSCSECQQLLAEYEQLDDIRSIESDLPTWQPSGTQFASILQNIDTLESTTHATAKPAKKTGLFSQLSAWLRTIPRPAYWFMGLETVAIAALVLLMVAPLPQRQPEAQLYQTLSNERPAVTTNLPRLSVVFAEDITEKEIRTLLQREHGQLVQGPSLLGIYSVQLAAGGEQELQQTISNLRNHPKIKLVEAVSGVVQP